MTPIDPVTNTWTCCGQPRHTNRCTSNPTSYPYGSEPSRALTKVTPQPTCRDCAVSLGQHHHQLCCLAECQQCGGQQMMCECGAPQPGAVR